MIKIFLLAMAIATATMTVSCKNDDGTVVVEKDYPNTINATTWFTNDYKHPMLQDEANVKLKLDFISATKVEATMSMSNEEVGNIELVMSDVPYTYSEGKGKIETTSVDKIVLKMMNVEVSYDQVLQFITLYSNQSGEEAADLLEDFEQLKSIFDYLASNPIGNYTVVKTTMTLEETTILNQQQSF